MATKLSDIASHLNLSPAIVSRVLNDKPGNWASSETRQRILDTAREMKYRPSPAGRALVTGRTMQIGVSAADIGLSLGRGGRTPQLRGLVDAATAHHYSILVIPSPGYQADHTQFEEWVEGGKCDGFCVYSGQCDRSVYDYFQSRNVPYVIIGDPGDISLPQVDHDNYSYFHDAVAWLAAQGHSRIAFINPIPTGEELFPSIRVMMRAHREAMERFCGGFDPELSPRDCITNASVLEFIRAKRPTAVLLLGMSRVIQWQTLALRRGIAVPDDLAMLAHLDVNDLYYLERSFTTDGLACQTYDPRIAGLVAGEVLMQWVAGKPPAPARRLIPSEKPFWWRQPIEMNAPLPPREELSGETDEISLPPLVVSADLFRA